MSTQRNFIGGEWIGTPQTLPVINPPGGQVIGQIARSGAAEIDAAVRAAQAAMDGE